MRVGVLNPTGNQVQMALLLAGGSAYSVVNAVRESGKPRSGK